MQQGPEEEAKVAQLQDITGLSQEAALHLLGAVGFDLEDAVSVHFASLELGNREAAPGFSPTEAAAVRSPVFPVEDSTSEEEVHDEAAAAAEEESPSWFGSVRRSIFSLGQSMLGVASEDFEGWFRERYGSPTPTFCKDSYGDAAKEALISKRFLLVWFFQEENTATEMLCRSVLQNRLLLRMLRRDLVLWAGDINRFEPGQIARLLGVTNFPGLVVFEPVRNPFDAINAAMFCLEWPLGTFCRPLLRLTPDQPGGLIDADQALAQLAAVAEEHNQQLRAVEENAEIRNYQLAEDRRLREEQDREFEESLMADQLAAIRNSEASVNGATTQVLGAGVSSAVDASSHAAAAAQAAAELAAAQAQLAQLAEEEARRVARGVEILAAAEPDPASEVVARISLRLPSGDRLQRIFRPQQPLAEVYEWAHCCRLSAAPKSFELCTNFPVRSLTDKSATLQDLGLLPSAALVLKSIEP